MKLLYTIAIFFYSTLASLFSLFNKKAKLRMQGLKATQKELAKMSLIKATRIWVHCASLGEFEQGRPIIEQLKKKYPEKKIVLTFFSPSGYEVRRNTQLADYVLYLPYDFKKTAEKFISDIDPEMAIFIKYEFWHWFIQHLKEKKIPTYLASAIFREDQVFFKPYGAFFRKILSNFTGIFVQNEKSLALLESININNGKVAGDTRFDRVLEISKNKKEILKINEFKNNKKLFIAGSTWPPDEAIIVKFININQLDLKFIIAPHEIHKAGIDRLKQSITKKVILFSESNLQNISNFDVLIIDSIGFLSSLYAYAEVGYIGGGFGVGIHNTLEAATFGLPIIFGARYDKFQEAKDLIDCKAASSINNYLEFEEKVTDLFLNDKARVKAGKMAKNYILKNAGATESVLQNMKI